MCQFFSFIIIKIYYIKYILYINKDPLMIHQKQDKNLKWNTHSLFPSLHTFEDDKNKKQKLMSHNLQLKTQQLSFISQMISATKILVIEFYGHDYALKGGSVSNTQNCVVHVFQGLVIRNKNKSKSNKSILWLQLQSLENNWNICWSFHLSS